MSTLELKRRAYVAVIFCIAVCAAGCAREEISTERIRELLDRGRYAEAEQLSRKAVTEFRATAGDSLPLAEDMDLWVLSLWRLGHGKDAETMDVAQRALALKEHLAGPNDPAVVRSLANLGILLHDNGDFDKSRDALERALTICSVASVDDLLHAHVLLRLAMVSVSTGEYEEARTRLDRALTLIHRETAAHELERADILNTLGILNFYIDGEIALARKRYEQVLEIRTAILGPEHPLLAGPHNNLGLIYRELGDDVRAKSSFQRAIAIRATVNPDHPLNCAPLSNLATIEKKHGELERAETHFRQALRIARGFGEDHPFVGDISHNLGVLQHEIAELDSASVLYDQALRVYRAAYGDSHFAVAKVLHDIGTLSYEKDSLSEAKDHYETCLALRERIFGSRHPEYAFTLGHLAVVHLASGHIEEAFEAALRTEDIGREHLVLTARSLPERETLMYSQIRVDGLSTALHIVAEGLLTEAADRRRAWDALVRSRGLVLEEMAMRSRIVASSRSSGTTSVATELEDIRKRLAELTIRGPEEAGDAYRREIAMARKQKETIERRFLNLEPTINARASSRKTGFEAVRASLPEGSVLVAFAEYGLPRITQQERQSRRKSTLSATKRNMGKVRNRLLAFVLQAGQREPAVISLGDMTRIDSLSTDWAKEASQGSFIGNRTQSEAQTAYRESAAALTAAIWDPLEAALGDKRRIFVVADGSLQFVNLAALPVGDKEYLIEEGWQFHYLSTERALLDDEERAEPGVGLLALGGADFYDDQALAPQLQTWSAVDLDTNTTVLGLRRAATPCLSLSEIVFEDLPGTRQEIRTIEEIWNSSRATEPHPTLLVGRHASESRFKAEAPGKRFLHLATHGFFLGSECGAQSTSTRGITAISTTFSSSDIEAPANPLLLCGLAMAGVNHRDTTAEKLDDGIVTGEEIVSLDLRGIEWAVLSACDTGIGEAVVGEGVLGLRRAFEVAGVRSMVMSLWPVSDQATLRWMRNLYEARWKRGAGVSESVYAASLQTLEELRSQGKPSHPFYWAAFVSTGDWK